jgi:hypothetical protein
LLNVAISDGFLGSHSTPWDCLFSHFPAGERQESTNVDEIVEFDIEYVAARSILPNSRIKAKALVVLLKRNE